MSSGDDRRTTRRQMRDRLVQWQPIALLRYNSKFIRAVLRVNGLRAGVVFLDQLGATFKEMGARYGKVLGSLVLGVSGSFLGCRYCGVTHLYAANIDYFLATGRLFPLDELDIVEWQKLPFDELEQLLIRRLAGDEFAEERRVIERLFALRLGEIPKTEEDHVLRRVLDVWNALGECTIGFSFNATANEIPPMLHAPTPLKEIRRYREAREAQRRAAR